ncbi:MAG: SDR family oxidoreductase [Armatimonadetes bacterium]|nr:SDR family oxidoreductase [Armatimonadota bacterium]
MNILLTGGCGFIGSHLAERLLAEGHAVTCIDNFLTGSRANAEILGRFPAFRLIEQDVCEPLRERVDCDWIFHLASPASPVHYRRFAVETLLTNSQGTYRMLETARQQRARFLVASTSESYGDPDIHPQREDYWGHVNPVGERSCYDESKRFSEAITMEYWRTHGTDVRVMRFFNTYGPRMQRDDGRIVPNMIGQALLGKPLTVYGDGMQTRSFCYVSDLVDGIIRAMWCEEAKAEVINLGNPDEFTVMEFVETLKRLLEKPLEVIYKPLPSDDPRRRKPDIGKARRLLGWEPTIKLEEGLHRTMKWFEETMGEAAS